MSFRRKSLVICFTILYISALFSQAYPDRHSTNLSDGWLSCQTSANPNPLRGNSHWIMYNLGDTYALTTSKIWNFNTPARVNSDNNGSWSLQPLPGKLEDGMKDILIDLSTDGVTWKEHSRFTIPKAPGSSFYEGVFGPDFSGKTARYVLITATSNHGGSCYGLGELKIKSTAITTTTTSDPLADAILSVYPNPFTDLTALTLQNFPAGEVVINILDITGKSYKNLNYTIRENYENINISGSDLPSGLYILQVTQNEASKSIKLEIVR